MSAADPRDLAARPEPAGHSPDVCPYCSNPLRVLDRLIRSELPYQHWRVSKTGLDGLVQVLKWIQKIRCHDALEVDGESLLEPRR